MWGLRHGRIAKSWKVPTQQFHAKSWKLMLKVPQINGALNKHFGKKGSDIVSRATLKPIEVCSVIKLRIAQIKAKHQLSAKYKETLSNYAQFNSFLILSAQQKRKAFKLMSLKLLFY